MKKALATIFIVLFAASAMAMPFLSSQAAQARQTLTMLCKGDLTMDGQVNFADINPFVLFIHYHNEPQFWAADITNDSFVDDRDINPFVDVLTNQQDSNYWDCNYSP